MKIHSLGITGNIQFNSSIKNTTKTQTAGQNLQTDSLCTNELLGRSIISFKNKDKFLKPKNTDEDVRNRKKDAIFIDNISKRLQFETRDTKLLTKIINRYLNDNGLKTLNDLNTDEGLRMQAEMCDIISDTLDLDDNSTTMLLIELQERYENENYIACSFSYFQDKPFISSACSENGLNEEFSGRLYQKMSQMADRANLDDIFSLLNKEKCPNGTSELFIALQTDFHRDTDTAENLMMSLAKIASIPYYKRAKIVEEEKPANKTYQEMAKTSFAILIKDTFKLPPESVDYAKSIIDKYEKHPKNLSAAAYFIADKYDLSAAQQEKIKHILEPYFEQTK